ncbi:TetR/AcrR family transcriptional regulator [Rhodococcus pyridinivorans]|uniref:TetR/AcrR family transcriptional regulator n=1 Tax=Rhodococcus pyridinivorans TaxID=103816 RepID=UPI0020C6EBED|nr:TetR/AcrR family transcriptional regulator [Rhodococcus pyridinivorans]UTM35556.1 TetR/AcrR family transcriptional regulator [Rhodococcus pyridinivorans]
MPPRPETGHSRRSPASRKAILDAAFDLVTEVGYSKLGIEAIAARAGVGKQTIYRWWPSKGAVLLDAYLAHTQGDAGDEASLPDTGDLRADLVAVLQATVAELRDPTFAVPLRALTVAVLEDPGLAAEYEHRLDAPMREMKKARLRAAQSAGQLPDDLDLDVAVDMLFAPVAQKWSTAGEPPSDDYVRTLVETVLSGLTRPSEGDRSADL